MIDKKYTSYVLALTAASLLPCSTALAGSASSRTWFVSTTGFDFYNYVGTSAIPFETIKRAIAMANDGDTIHIYAGTYRPSSTLMLDGKSISFVGDVHGDGSPATVIRGDADADGDGVFDLQAVFTLDGRDGTECSFSNLVLRDGSWAIDSYFGWPGGRPDFDISDEHHVSITNSSFIGNLADVNGPSITIKDSTFEDQYMGVYSTHSLYVEMCDFLGGYSGVQFGNWHEPSNFEVRNSQFTGYWGYAIGSWGSISTALLANLIIRENEGSGVSANFGMLIADCRIESNGGAGIVAFNRSTDPDFEGEPDWRGEVTRNGCRVENCTISANAEYGIEDKGGDMLDTQKIEGVRVSDSVICGNGIAQVWGGYYFDSGSYEWWKAWNSAASDGGHLWGDYWKGPNNTVRRQCFDATEGDSAGPSGRGSSEGDYDADDPALGNDSGDDSADSGQDSDSGQDFDSGRPGRGGQSAPRGGLFGRP